MNSIYILQGLQDVEVVGQFETGTSGKTHLLNSKISSVLQVGKCAYTHAHTNIYIYIYWHTYIHVAFNYVYIYPIYPYTHSCTECPTMIQLQCAARNAPNLISPHIPSGL
jgi:hypothetical protein